jgi:PHAX RNA-binding domain-containing protein
MDTLTVEQLAAILQEPKVPLLRQVLRTVGPERCAAILADTLAWEARGGMLTKDGTAAPHPGGRVLAARQRAGDAAGTPAPLLPCGAPAPEGPGTRTASHAPPGPHLGGGAGRWADTFPRRSHSETDTDRQAGA